MNRSVYSLRFSIFGENTNVDAKVEINQDGEKFFFVSKLEKAGLQSNIAILVIRPSLPSPRNQAENIIHQILCVCESLK